MCLEINYFLFLNKAEENFPLKMGVQLNTKA
jgi:hypothetical protein